MKLGEIFNIRSGYLKSRSEDKKSDYRVAIYSKKHFDLDEQYFDDKLPLESEFVAIKADIDLTVEGEIIIDSLSQKAAIVSNKSSGMFLAFNYYRLSIKDRDVINPDYFVAWFNLSDDVKRQLSMTLQGAILKKLTLKQVHELEITLPNLEKQVQIANIYLTMHSKYNKALEIKNTEEDILKNLLQGGF